MRFTYGFVREGLDRADPASGPFLTLLHLLCGMPKEVKNAEIHVGTNNVLNAMLRYTCKEGYKRKAGTSTLIKCEQKDNKLHWTESNLKCIHGTEPFSGMAGGVLWKGKGLYFPIALLLCLLSKGDPALPPSTPSPKPTTSAPIPEETSPTSQGEELRLKSWAGGCFHWIPWPRFSADVNQSSSSKSIMLHLFATVEAYISQTIMAAIHSPNYIIPATVLSSRVLKTSKDGASTT
uniref:Sushi domain-containing protein n=1 Tax=Crocodylus porosus TaxID=8502 RepID=A0A7M4E1Y1_CROPO